MFQLTVCYFILWISTISAGANTSGLHKWLMKEMTYNSGLKKKKQIFMFTDLEQINRHSQDRFPGHKQSPRSYFQSPGAASQLQSCPPPPSTSLSCSSECSFFCSGDPPWANTGHLNHNLHQAKNWFTRCFTNKQNRDCGLLLPSSTAELWFISRMWLPAEAAHHTAQLLTVTKCLATSRGETYKLQKLFLSTPASAHLREGSNFILHCTCKPLFYCAYETQLK